VLTRAQREDKEENKTKGKGNSMKKEWGGGGRGRKYKPFELFNSTHAAGENLNEN